MRNYIEIEQDLNIFQSLDESNIDRVLLQIPRVIIRLVLDRKEAEAALASLIIQKRELEGNLIRYYLGYSDYGNLNRPPFGNKVAATNLSKFVSTDQAMIDLKKKIIKIETYINFIDRSLEAVNTIQWVLKSYIDRTKIE